MKGGVRSLELSFFIERDLTLRYVPYVLDHFHHTSDKQNGTERMHDRTKFKGLEDACQPAG